MVSAQSAYSRALQACCRDETLAQKHHRSLPKNALVSSAISQQNRIEVYRQAIKVVRSGTGNQSALPPDITGCSIQVFSDKSLALMLNHTWPIRIDATGLTET